MPPAADSWKRHLPFHAAALAAAISLYFWMCRLGMNQFGGMDGGVVSSAAWQLHLGYIPYKDTIGAVPPLFLMGCKAAFDWFGVSWFSIVRIVALHTGVTLVFHYWLAGRVFGRPWSLLLAIATQLLTNVTGSFWMYNQITSIHAVLFLTAVFGWVLTPQRRGGLTLVAATGAVLLLAKPNIALPLIGLVLLSLVLQPPEGNGRSKVMALFAGMAAGALAMMLAFRVSLPGLIASFGLLADRADWQHLLAFVYRERWWEVVQSAQLFVPACAAATIWFVANSAILRSPPFLDLQLRIPDAHPVLLLLVLTSVVTSIIGVGTNNSFIMHELTLPITALAVLLVHCWSRDRRLLRLASTGLLVASVIGLAGNAANIAKERLHIMEVGRGLFYELPAAPLQSPPPYFAGLTAGDTLNEVLHDFDKVFEWCQCRNQNGHVFIGPRIDFGYPAYGIAPAKGLPLWWEMPPGEVTQQFVGRFDAADIQYAIFLMGDYTLMPSSLISLLTQSYDMKDFGTLTAYRRRSLNDETSQLQTADSMAAQLQSAEAYMALSVKQYQARNYIGCVSSAVKANQIHESALAYYNMAACYGALNLIDEEIRAARSALRIDPNHELAQRMLKWGLAKKRARK